MDIWQKAEALLSTDARFVSCIREGNTLFCTLDDDGLDVVLEFGVEDVTRFANMYDDQGA